jgi:hypothetical protein
MWFIFITARLFIFLSFQPRLAATLLRSCSVVNSLIRRAGLSPAFQPTSLAQPLNQPRPLRIRTEPVRRCRPQPWINSLENVGPHTP